MIYYCVLLIHNIPIDDLSPLILHSSDNQLTRRFTSPTAICISTLGGGRQKLQFRVSTKVLSILPITTPFIPFPRHTIITFHGLHSRHHLRRFDSLEQEQGRARMHDCGRSAGWLCCITDGLRMACGHKNTREGEDSRAGCILVFARGRR